MEQFIFSIGNARSGKSTYLRALGKTIPNSVVLSADSFRFAISGERFNLDSELHVRASLIAAAKALLRDGYTVLLDETNTSLYNQKQLLDLWPNPRIILIHTPAEICIQRARDCNQLDLIPSILRMEQNLNSFYLSIKNEENDKRINKYNTTEIGPIMHHLFSDDPYRKN